MNMYKDTQYIVAICLLILLTIMGIFVFSTKDTYGSAIQGQEYNATSTANGGYGWGTTVGLIKTGQGSLGSIVLSGTSAGVLAVYDATTTDVTKRTGNRATSTIIRGRIDSGQIAGTYTFDVSFSDGLIGVLEAGTMPTTTITWR